MRSVEYWTTDVTFYIRHNPNAEGISHLSFSWDYVQDIYKEMGYGKYMLHIK